MAVVTTIFGAILGLIVTRWDSWRETSKRGDLRGEWLAISHGGDHDLVKDKVIISKKRGKLHIRNGGNDFGYAYESFCSIEAGNILHGTWRSLREGSSVGGRVLMIVNPQGTTISGVYTGENSEGTNLILAWVMGRSEEDLCAATRKLQQFFKFPTCT